MEMLLCQTMFPDRSLGLKYKPRVVYFQIIQYTTIIIQLFTDIVIFDIAGNFQDIYMTYSVRNHLVLIIQYISHAAAPDNVVRYNFMEELASNWVIISFGDAYLSIKVINNHIHPSIYGYLVVVYL